jgi:MOSC domain-containing protein YiiM
MGGVVLQVNVKPQTPGERGLPKRPVADTMVTKEGVQGDYNVYRHDERHDDPDCALLIMPIETIEQLNSEGWPVKAGDLGENFTTKGIGCSSFEVGKVFGVGDSRFQVSKACDPCDNLFLLPYVGKSKGPQFLKAMLGRRGWYARVLREGKVSPGDQITQAGTQQTFQDV